MHLTDTTEILTTTTTNQANNAVKCLLRFFCYIWGWQNWIQWKTVCVSKGFDCQENYVMYFVAQFSQYISILKMKFCELLRFTNPALFIKEMLCKAFHFSSLKLIYLFQKKKIFTYNKYNNNKILKYQSVYYY